MSDDGESLLFLGHQADGAGNAHGQQEQCQARHHPIPAPGLSEVLTAGAGGGRQIERGLVDGEVRTACHPAEQESCKP